jgi:hypothetical protein
MRSTKVCSQWEEPLGDGVFHKHRGAGGLSCGYDAGGIHSRSLDATLPSSILPFEMARLPGRERNKGPSVVLVGLLAFLQDAAVPMALLTSPDDMLRTRFGAPRL